MSFIFSRSITDSDWAGHAFRVKPSDLSDEYIAKRKYYTTSSRKFVDTSWGGHFAVNPYPQFTRNCDLNHQSFYTGNRVYRDGYGDFGGVGRWWSEVLDDNQQEIHIRAGVVRFNSMFTFFTNFYNVEASILSRRGREASIFYTLGRAAGYVGSIILQPFILGAEAIRFFLSTPRTKFYYLVPAMHMYWRAVSLIMNSYMVNAGLTTYFAPGDNLDVDKSNFDPILNQYRDAEEWREQTRIFGQQFGDRIITRNGGIDVFAISTRAQRLGQNYRKKINAELNSRFDNITDANRGEMIEQFVEERLDRIIGELPGPSEVNKVISQGVDETKFADGSEKSYLDMFMEFMFSDTDKEGQPKEAVGKLEENEGREGDTSNPEYMPNSTDYGEESFKQAFLEKRVAAGVEGELPTENTPQPAPPPEQRPGKGAMSYLRELGNAFKSNMEMGAEFVTFRVSNTGTQSESFSNSSGDSGLMDTINSNSSAARSARFNIAGGNVGGFLGTALQALEESVAGVLDSVQLGGLMALGGSAFIDIQKVYQNSSADMMATSITIPLRAWSADPVTITKDVIYPLACALALGMPKSTGSRSYDEPFLVETFLQGRSQIREGRVRSLSITRGVGDVAWTKDGHALGIDVTMDIEDMSGVVGVPINPTTSRLASMVSGAAGAMLGDTAANAIDATVAAFSKSSYSEDNKFGDYMNVLGAVDLHRQINTIQKWKVKMAQTRMNMEQWRSPHMAMSIFTDTLPGRLIQAFGRPTDRN